MHRKIKHLSGLQGHDDNPFTDKQNTCQETKKHQPKRLNIFSVDRHFTCQWPQKRRTHEAQTGKKLVSNLDFQRVFLCLTSKLPVNESTIIHWQVKCLSVTYFPATDKYFTCQSKNFLHWQVIYLSVKNFQIISFKRGFLQEININNH